MEDVSTAEFICSFVIHSLIRNLREHFTFILGTVLMPDIPSYVCHFNIF